MQILVTGKTLIFGICPQAQHSAPDFQVESQAEQDVCCLKHCIFHGNYFADLK
ncbi:MAG: hypothetical protein K6G02_00945 [Lactobacillus sp.]|nr:hypothetical protein [Lactobacillus sp.]